MEWRGLSSRRGPLCVAEMDRGDVLREVADVAGLRPAAADRIDCELAEHAVALRLRLVEPLIGRALVRKRGMGLTVAGHIRRLVAEQSRLHVDDVPGLAIPVIDLSHGATLVRANAFELDRDAEVDADLAKRIPQVLVRELPVAA